MKRTKLYRKKSERHTLYRVCFLNTHISAQKASEPAGKNKEIEIHMCIIKHAQNVSYKFNIHNISIDRNTEIRKDTVHNNGCLW